MEAAAETEHRSAGSQPRPSGTLGSTLASFVGTLGLFFLVMGWPASALAQVVIAPEESLASTRPEAWAMRYFSSALRGHGLGRSELSPGEFAFGGELDWLPSLDEEQERVGFDGLKHEDLDRSSWAGRLRGAVGLPADWVLDVGWVPPVRVKGLEPNVVTVGISRSVNETSSWVLGLRLSSDYGRVEGDITCDRETVAAGPDPDLNPFSCLEVSSDVMTWWSASLEGSIAWAPDGARYRPYLTVTGTYLDAEFQVDARYGNLIDRTLLTNDSSLTTVGLGLEADIADRWQLAFEVAYTPLTVVRSGRRSHDGLINPRLAIACRF